jgi:hypothetical protein
MSAAANPHAYTVRQLGRLLRVDDRKVHATADRLGLPFDERHGVDKNGNPIVRRVYLRVSVDAALDERGRLAARRAS